MNYFISGIKKYAVIEGRASRREFWMYALVYFICLLILAVIEGFLGMTRDYLTAAFALGLFLPTFAVQIRRLHDTNRSGWWTLLALIPLIGQIGLIILLALKGDKGSNQYGSASVNQAG